MSSIDSELASPGGAAGTAARVKSWRSPLELAVLGAIWGASFLFMRIAAPEFGALALVEIRLALGALVLLPFLWRARHLIGRGQWLRLAGIGAINSAIPFALFAWAAERAPAAIGAITNATTVLFTALVAFMLFGERIGVRRGIALLIGFAGVVVLAGAPAVGADVTLAAIAGTLAAFLYGLAANLIKRHLVGVPPTAVAATTLTCAAVLFLPLGWSGWPSHGVSAASWISAVLLGVVCTGIAYAIYFHLIRRIGAPRAAAVTYLVPLFAVAWAWLLLGETPTLPMIVAAALILGSVAVSQKSNDTGSALSEPRTPAAPGEAM